MGKGEPLQGASENGGRWNHIGFPAVYAGICASATVIEVLVHHEALFLQVAPLTIISFTVKVSACTEITPSQLPEDWREDPPPREIPDMGTEWLKKAETPVLIVPSATVPQDDMLVLNPRHPDLDIENIRPETYTFDPRLLQG